MAGSAEILIVVMLIIALAVILPLLLDVELPPSFSICSVFVGALNLTCTEPEGNVTFVGIPPIVITANNSENTITWNFTLAAENATHQNIGGGAEVFKNETLGPALFRTLVGGGGVTVNELDETIEIRTGGPGGGGPLQNINNPQQNIFNSTQEGNTVVFVGKGIAITNASSVEFALNATADELLDVNYTSPPDERDILVWNVTTMQFENERIDNLISLRDVHFNAEESTIDDLTGVDCVNDVTFSLFDNAAIHDYRREAIEFCPDSDDDDNITWLYVVPKDYTGTPSFNFQLFWTDDDSDADAFMKRIDADGDDCEESIGPLGPVGDVTCSSSDLELHCENCVEPDDNDLIGMRWTNVTIPQGVTIINATIQFHVDQTNPDDPIIVRFKGHDHDNAPAFSTSDFDISSRANTTAFVDWNIPDWVSVSDEGPAQETPNLASIVQEIIDRPGWVSGNAMVIKTTEWTDCTPTSCPTNFGERHAESHDGEPSSAAQLKVTWQVGGGSPDPVCFEFSLLALQNTENMNGDFIARQTVCENRSGNDNLSMTEFITDETDHQFEPEDLVFFRIHRPNDFVVDDFESNVYVFGSELQWLN